MIDKSTKYRKLSKASCIYLISVLVLVLSGFTNTTHLPKNKKMSKNKEIVMRYMEGFNATDHEKILSCLSNDVIWEMPGVYYHTGKAAFDEEIENDAFVGSPTIKIVRLVEEADVVIAEGTVQSKRKDGGLLDAVFCDVFILENGLIKKLTSYFMVKPTVKK